MVLDFDLLQKLEERVRSAEALIRRLQEENQRLAEQLELAGLDSGFEPAGVPADRVETLLEERASIRSSIHRMLHLLERIQP